VQIDPDEQLLAELRHGQQTQKAAPGYASACR
jgi:hypothetical protein